MISIHDSLSVVLAAAGSDPLSPPLCIVYALSMTVRSASAQLHKHSSFMPLRCVVPSFAVGWSSSSAYSSSPLSAPSSSPFSAAFAALVFFIVVCKLLLYVYPLSSIALVGLADSLLAA